MHVIRQRARRCCKKDDARSTGEVAWRCKKGGWCASHSMNFEKGGIVGKQTTSTIRASLPHKIMYRTFRAFKPKELEKLFCQRLCSRLLDCSPYLFRQMSTHTLSIILPTFTLATVPYLTPLGGRWTADGRRTKSCAYVSGTVLSLLNDCHSGSVLCVSESRYVPKHL